MVIFREPGDFWGRPVSFTLFVRVVTLRLVDDCRTDLWVGLLRGEGGRADSCRERRMSAAAGRSRARLRVTCLGRKLSAARLAAFAFGNQPGLSWEQFEETRTLSTPSGKAYSEYRWQADHVEET